MKLIQHMLAFAGLWTFMQGQAHAISSGERFDELDRGSLISQKTGVPYVVSSPETHSYVDPKTLLIAESLKKFISLRVQRTHSTDFLGLVTCKDFVNDVVAVTLGTACMANPYVYGGSEALNLLLMTYNLPMYGELPSNLSLIGFTAQTVDGMVSEEVEYNVISPLAKIYEQVGKNVRGLARVDHFYLPTSLFNYVQSWFEIGNLNLLPIWLSFPYVSTLPVDWIMAQTAFDLAVFTLEQGRRYPQYASKYYKLYRTLALKLKRSMEADEDFEADDLEELFSGYDHFSESEEIDEVDKLEDLYDLKETIRDELKDNHWAYMASVHDGRNEGSYREIFGGAVVCLFKDALYTSMTSELLWLEATGKVYKGKSERKLGQADFSKLDEDEAKSLVKMHRLLRDDKVSIQEQKRNSFALTERERQQGSKIFSIKTCVQRYPNRYLKYWTPEESQVSGNLWHRYRASLEPRVNKAQAQVQNFGKHVIENEFTWDKAMEKSQ